MPSSELHEIIASRGVNYELSTIYVVCRQKSRCGHSSKLVTYTSVSADLSRFSRFAHVDTWRPHRSPSDVDNHVDDVRILVYIGAETSYIAFGRDKVSTLAEISTVLQK